MSDKMTESQDASDTLPDSSDTTVAEAPVQSDVAPVESDTERDLIGNTPGDVDESAMIVTTTDPQGGIPFPVKYLVLTIKKVSLKNALVDTLQLIGDTIQESFSVFIIFSLKLGLVFSLLLLSSYYVITGFRTTITIGISSLAVAFIPPIMAFVYRDTTIVKSVYDLTEGGIQAWARFVIPALGSLASLWIISNVSTPTPVKSFILSTLLSLIIFTPLSDGKSSSWTIGHNSKTNSLHMGFAVGLLVYVGLFGLPV